MSKLATKNTAVSPSLLSRAQLNCGRMVEAEAGTQRSLQQLYACMWEFGRDLVQLKESGDIRHGNWEFFVSSNFPQLGRTEKARCCTARYCMAFYKAQPKRTVPCVFTPDSIRKCVFRMAPEKDRPKLAGDQNISPAPTHLTFINNFSKWGQKVAKGLLPAPKPEIFRREMTPVVREIVRVGGREWLEEILQEA